MAAPARSPLPQYIRASPYRSNAPPRSPGPPFTTPPLLLPTPTRDEFPKAADPANANATDDHRAAYAIGFATISGALSLRSTHLQALQNVPRELERDTRSDSTAGSVRVVTRARARILDHGTRIAFAFGKGGRTLKRYGMPMYALVSASAEELERQMGAAGRDQVMMPFRVKQIRIRVLWPLPYGLEESQISYEEPMRVDLECTRVQLAMSVARVFFRFVERHRASSLAKHPSYPWLLLPDAFYRVWLMALEHIESNLFVMDLKYVKDYPNVNY